MAQIQPIQMWINGSQKTAEVFVLRSIADDLATAATFYWELKEADVTTQDADGNDVVQPGAVLQVGNLSMAGQEYTDWDDSNASAYAWASGKLNISIVAGTV